MMELLENRVLQEGSDDKLEKEKLALELKEAKERNRTLEKEKKAAQERSDTYKKRFLVAQDAVQTLHRKNTALSSNSWRSQRKNVNESANFFSSGYTNADKDFSPGTKKLIFAPDTYFTEREEDHTRISSDDEDFQPTFRKSKKSPQKPVKSMGSRKNITTINDSFFARPKSPINVSRSKHSKSVIDMDETRMDDPEQMEASIFLGDEDWDTIPQSPVLSVGKERRLASFQSSRNSIPKYDLQAIVDDKIIQSQSLLSGDGLLQDEFQDSADSEAGNPIRDSLPLHHMRVETAHNITTPKLRPGNTSLDDLFDKTEGDLETTSMMQNDTTYCDDDATENEDDIDALLLEGLHDVEKSCGTVGGDAAEGGDAECEDEDGENKHPPEIPPKSRLLSSWDNPPSRLVWNDSFDVLPVKSKDKVSYKYQEVVRNHEERKKLDGKACPQCEAYYSDLSEEERRATLREVCRHKHVNAPPSTPDNFWEVQFPSTEECKKRGYIVEHSDLSTQAKQQQVPRRRRKPLQSLYSKTKKK